MSRVLIGIMLASIAVGCGAGREGVAAPPVVAKSAAAPPERAPAALPVAAPPAAIPDAPVARAESGPWIGAAGASDLVLAGGGDSFLGVWVDVPSVKHTVLAPVSLALAIDTSGSMSGAKMDNARVAASSLVEHLADGDIVSITTFSDQANERLAPTRLDPTTRRRILSAIAELTPSGGTNMFDGLRLAETRAAAAPATHTVRRVVMISDGIANVGPSSPEVLGAIAARAAEAQGIQVTAIGVGLDYDEKTLNALAVRSSGRLYHLAEPREMASILEHELALLQATMATEAFIEVVPAPGVRVFPADGVQATTVGGALRVSLGSMFGGQHREVLFRTRVADATPGARPLASVRLHFRDPAEGNLARVQEVIARYELTSDAGAVALRGNSRTQSIVAVQDAAQASLRAAQQVSAGDFDAADRELARVEDSLRQSASRVVDAKEKQRVLSAVASVSKARAGAGAAAAAPPAARPAKARAEALDMNAGAMRSMGY